MIQTNVKTDEYQSYIQTTVKTDEYQSYIYTNMPFKQMLKRMNTSHIYTPTCHSNKC